MPKTKTDWRVADIYHDKISLLRGAKKLKTDEPRYNDVEADKMASIRLVLFLVP